MCLAKAATARNRGLQLNIELSCEELREAISNKCIARMLSTTLRHQFMHNADQRQPLIQSISYNVSGLFGSLFPQLRPVNRWSIWACKWTTTAYVNNDLSELESKLDRISSEAATMLVLLACHRNPGADVETCSGMHYERHTPTNEQNSRELREEMGLPTE